MLGNGRSLRTQAEGTHGTRDVGVKRDILTKQEGFFTDWTEREKRNSDSGRPERDQRYLKSGTMKVTDPLNTL